MDYFSGGHRFAHLSLADLVRARDQFHPHLVHKRNVVGTAIGRYLIRKGDPQPGEKRRRPPGPKPPRTIETSEIREYSWPCVLVFVSEWLDEPSFGTGVEIPASDYVPKTIYLDDGKSVPICLVLAPRTDTPPVPPPEPLYPSSVYEGGQPIRAVSQQVPRIATVGCLLTDGHKVYALTSRHVAGQAGERLLDRDGRVIGVTSALQLGRVPFESVYAPLIGTHSFVNLDVGLIEVDDLRRWSSGIHEVGPAGPLAALSTYNLSLDLIGCPLRTHGAMSGVLEGRIAALFYRYKSVGGFDYVADFLIGSRNDAPLTTFPGDSGAVWVLDDGNRNPLAVQWGGTVLGGPQLRSTFAFASNLSTICRELTVDVYRGPGVAAFEYWGAVGHRRIGDFACDLIEDADLKTLMTANRDNVRWLANVPDTTWKSLRGSKENPNHYADIDYRPGGGESLDDLTPDPASLKVKTWQKYYDAIGWTEPRQRGLLPFRVRQAYEELVGYAAAGDVKHFVTAAGVLAHYVGDACQPQHGSYLDDGDPFRFPNGKKSSKMLDHGKGYGHGVHKAYETVMIQAKEPELASLVTQALPASHGEQPITGAQEAGYSIIRLIRAARAVLDPMKIIETYVKAIKDGDDVNDALWDELKKDTVTTVVNGCRRLAMLWDSAWAEGRGSTTIPSAKLVHLDPTIVRGVVENEPQFLESLTLDEIGGP